MRGNTVRARNVAQDVFALAKNVVGGEIKEYIERIKERKKDKYREFDKQYRTKH